MKKVISIHLNDKVFQIEEDAYLYLKNALETQWQKAELESTIAERLAQKLSGRTVVMYPDVVEVLYQLGFSASESQQKQQQGAKKLYRQVHNKMIAGVCTGLGEYFEVDFVVLRILFVLAFFLGSMGFWLYLALWIIVPKISKSLKS
jgi:phage shock protein PspC (stress-responsive transcriptional regulator)